MDVEFIEAKIQEIIKALEKEVMEVVSDESLDKKETNQTLRSCGHCSIE